MTFTRYFDSCSSASHLPIFPSPAMMTRQLGLSVRRKAFTTAGISRRAARKKISSPSSITLSPSRVMARSRWKMATTCVSTFGSYAQLFRAGGIALDRTQLVARLVPETEQLCSVLFSSVSHDLRTPITSIIGSTTSLLEYAESFSESN